MKIAICGGTGNTGSQLVDLALDSGHHVVVSARTPSKITNHHEHLTVVEGDATNPADLARAFDGCDAVASCLGNGGFLDQRRETTFYTDTIKAVLDAMQTANVGRLIAITSTGVEHDPAAPWFYRKLIRPQLKTYDNMSAMEAAIENTSLAWTIVRPSWLRPGEPTGKYRVRDRKNPDGGWKIKVGDVAHFMNRELATDEWVGQYPGLAE